MTRAAALALTLLALAGCAGQQQAPPPRALRFAAFVSPRVGLPADPASGALATEDALLEVVTALSTEAGLDFVLVGGPLVATPEAAHREALAGALGSIAAPVLVALSPDDDPAQDLLEALERGVQRHPGKRAYTGPAVAGWRPLAIGPDGDLPSLDEGDASLTVAVGAGAAPEQPPHLLVGGLKEAGFSAARKDGRVHLGLPPLHVPPHVFAVVTVEPTGKVTAELRTAAGEPWPDAPVSPPPVFVDVPAPGS